MRHFTWSKIIGCVGLALLLALATPVAADEMWVHPGDKADREVGNWGTTNNGEARFSFSIPDDLTELESARVVLMGKKTTGITWDADLSISQDGAARDAYTASASGSASMVADAITEVDVTALFPAALAGGVDVAGLAFQGAKNGDLYVVGLRISYAVANPLADAGCEAGELLSGFDSAGEAVCVGFGDVLADVSCGDGEVLTGFDSAGDPVCVAGDTLLAGVTCPDGEVLQGFTADGTPICVDIDSGDTGTGGGGGEGGGGGGGGGGGTGEPAFSIDDVSVLEGDSGTVSALFTVTLSEALTSTQATIDYATADDTATAGSDYTAASGTLTFFPGQTSASFSVTVFGDLDVEPTETFNVNLSNVGVVGPEAAPTIADSQGVGTIINDDLSGGR